MFEKILVPLDGTDVTTRVLPYATDLGTSVTLFSVVQTTIFDEARRGKGTADRRLVNEIKNRLRETADQFGVDAEVEVSVGSPADEIAPSPSEPSSALSPWSITGATGWRWRPWERDGPGGPHVACACNVHEPGARRDVPVPQCSD